MLFRSRFYWKGCALSTNSSHQLTSTSARERKTLKRICIQRICSLCFKLLFIFFNDFSAEYWTFSNIPLHTNTSGCAKNLLTGLVFTCSSHAGQISLTGCLTNDELEHRAQLQLNVATSQQQQEILTNFCTSAQHFYQAKSDWLGVNSACCGEDKCQTANHRRLSH